jgi:hypothetical protein
MHSVICTASSIVALSRESVLSFIFCFVFFKLCARTKASGCGQKRHGFLSPCRRLADKRHNHLVARSIYEFPTTQTYSFGSIIFPDSCILFCSVFFLDLTAQSTLQQGGILRWIDILQTLQAIIVIAGVVVVVCSGSW